MQGLLLDKLFKKIGDYQKIGRYMKEPAIIDQVNGSPSTFESTPKLIFLKIVAPGTSLYCVKKQDYCLISKNVS